ncbi:hypothetical protein [Spirosoma jeollabukense]
MWTTLIGALLVSTETSKQTQNPPNEPRSLSHASRPLRYFQLVAVHPTPTGVDGGLKTLLNKRTFDLYILIWLGCKPDLGTCILSPGSYPMKAV